MPDLSDTSWSAEVIRQLALLQECEPARVGGWYVSHKYDASAAALADRHYSRRTVGSPQFMPPGQTLVLVADGAVFGWWRPDPSSGILGCGPNGMLTYVWDRKIRSVNPGYCFKRAGWSAVGRSADGRKTLLNKPFCLAGCLGTNKTIGVST